MEMSTKTLVHFIAIALTGLSAGLFYAWSVSVIPGTKKIPDLHYPETMQAINRAILNPWFFLSFIGCLIGLGWSTYLHAKGDSTFWLLLSATIVYLIGTFGVTAFGNVPLNEALDALHLRQLSTREIKDWRTAYETKWNVFHTIRTLFAIVSFLMALLAAFTTTHKA